jgi:cyanate permease
MWGLINVGLSTLLNFTPGFLISSGFPETSAGALVSLITWVMIPSLTLGGYLAERLNRPNLIMSACFALIGAGMILLPVTHAPTLIFIGIGLVFGPLGGLSMALPAAVLSPENRSAGMGIFYTCSMAISAFLPAAAGFSRDITRSPAAPLVFGGALFLFCVVNLWLFTFFQQRWTSTVVKPLLEN